MKKKLQILIPQYKEDESIIKPLLDSIEVQQNVDLANDIGVIIVNDQRIDPITVVTGAASYPENIIDTLKAAHTTYSIDAMTEAKKLGNSKVFNIIVLGMAAQHMNFSKEDWIEVIKKTVPPKTVEINLKAFETGWSN